MSPTKRSRSKGKGSSSDTGSDKGATSANINVAVRVRPLTPGEEGEDDNVWIVNTRAATVRDATDEAGKTYPFNYVCPPGERTNQLFRKMVRPIIQAACQGYNGNVFAYGQTASGKTHTMLGTEHEAGIVLLAISDIFTAISEMPQRQFLLRVSCMEIYNECVHDLLGDPSVSLKVVDNLEGEVSILGLTQEFVRSPSEFVSVLLRGMQNRTIAATNANDRSSRAHTVFRISIESRARVVRPTAGSNVSGSTGGVGSKSARAAADEYKMVRSATLNLVDLSGSECINQLGSDDASRRTECRHINRSLLGLSRVIIKLSEIHAAEQSSSSPSSPSSSSSSSSPSPHVPFRDSKITRILQPALGGNSNTLFVCTLRPTPACRDESHNTLRFGSFARRIKTSVSINERLSDKELLKKYKLMVQDLKRKIKANQKTERLTIELKEQNSKMKKVIVAQEYNRAKLENTVKNLRQRIANAARFNRHVIGNESERSTARSSAASSGRATPSDGSRSTTPGPGGAGGARRRTSTSKKTSPQSPRRQRQKGGSEGQPSSPSNAAAAAAAANSTAADSTAVPDVESPTSTTTSTSASPSTSVPPMSQDAQGMDTAVTTAPPGVDVENLDVLEYRLKLAQQHIVALEHRLHVPLVDGAGGAGGAASAASEVSPTSSTTSPSTSSLSSTAAAGASPTTTQTAAVAAKPNSIKSIQTLRPTSATTTTAAASSKDQAVDASVRTTATGAASPSSPLVGSKLDFSSTALTSPPQVNHDDVSLKASSSTPVTAAANSSSNNNNSAKKHTQMISMISHAFANKKPAAVDDSAASAADADVNVIALDSPSTSSSNVQGPSSAAVADARDAVRAANAAIADSMANTAASSSSTSSVSSSSSSKSSALSVAQRQGYHAAISMGHDLLKHCNASNIAATAGGAKSKGKGKAKKPKSHMCRFWVELLVNGAWCVAPLEGPGSSGGAGQHSPSHTQSKSSSQPHDDTFPRHRAALCWKSKGMMSQKRRLMLDAVREVRFGHALSSSSSSSSSSSNKDAPLTISFVTDTRSVDVVCQQHKHYRDWYFGVRPLLQASTAVRS